MRREIKPGITAEGIILAASSLLTPVEIKIRITSKQNRYFPLHKLYYQF